MIEPIPNLPLPIKPIPKKGQFIEPTQGTKRKIDQDTQTNDKLFRSIKRKKLIDAIVERVDSIISEKFMQLEKYGVLRGEATTHPIPCVEDQFNFKCPSDVSQMITTTLKALIKKCKEYKENGNKINLNVRKDAKEYVYNAMKFGKITSAKKKDEKASRKNYDQLIKAEIPNILSQKNLLSVIKSMRYDDKTIYSICCTFLAILEKTELAAYISGDFQISPENTIVSIEQNKMAQIEKESNVYTERKVLSHIFGAPSTNAPSNVNRESAGPINLNVFGLMNESIKQQLLQYNFENATKINITTDSEEFLNLYVEPLILKKAPKKIKAVSIESTKYSILKLLNPNLLKLRIINLNKNNLGDIQFINLLSSLKENRIVLKELHIVENDLTNISMGSLSNFIKDETRLQALNISFNEKINAQGMRLLSSGLQENKSIIELDIWKLIIGDEGISVLVEAYLNSNKQFYPFISLFDNNVTVKGVLNFLKMYTMKGCLKRRYYIQIDKTNDPCNDMELKYKIYDQLNNLVDKFIESARLLYFNFVIEKKDVVILEKFLKKVTNSIVLAGFKFENYDAFHEFCNSLKINERLGLLNMSLPGSYLEAIKDKEIKIVNLHGNKFDIVGFSHLSAMLLNNKKLTLLNLDDCFPSDKKDANKCLQMLCDACKFAPCIEHLIMRTNKLNDADKCIYSLLQVSKTMQILDIAENEFTEEDLMSMEKAVKANSASKMMKIVSFGNQCGINEITI